jgi:GrpB-like predicted nucleotidyltransferase (UPF0157 family)
MPFEGGFDGIARVTRAIRDLKASVRTEPREPLERKIRRWQRLRLPELPPRLRAVRPYDSVWPVRFRDEASRIRQAADAALGPDLLADVHHIGSTSIPGLAAKSILDLLVAVRGVVATPEQLAVLEALGYRHYGASPCDHEAVWLWNVDAADVAFVIHLCSVDNPWVRTALNFRDYMRCFPAECARYEALKHELDGEQSRSLLEYSLVKLKLFYEVCERADAWRAAGEGQAEVR